MGKRTCIGLDVGSSAVRAAELVFDGETVTLRRFGQVGLPAGAVAEGEVRDQAAVTAAVKRLWQHGGFSGNSVVVGLGSQRAMVRQVTMPEMGDGELRSALQFKIGEFLPIPVEQAVVDFAPLPGGGDGGGRRVLLVAAQREVVSDAVKAVEAAGLQVRAVDVGALALMRSARGSDGGGEGGLEAVVGLGAELLTVAVREGGMARFVRTVAINSGRSAVPVKEEATVPGSGGHGNSLLLPARSNSAGAAVDRVDAIVAEVRSSLEYLLSQSSGRQFDRVLVTGGGAMTAGLLKALAAAVGAPVSVADMSVSLDRKALELTDEALDEARYRWLGSVGLAMWGVDPLARISLLPPEVMARRRERRLVVAAAAGVAVVALGLGAASFSQIRTASQVNANVSRVDAGSVALAARIRSLGFVLKVQSQLEQRHSLAVQGLIGDVDWTGLLSRLRKAMPVDMRPQTISLNKLASSSSGPLPAGSIVGSISLTASTTGGASAVKAFIDRASGVRGLEGLWVSSTTNSAGVTVVDAASNVTTAAYGTRAQRLPGGGK